MSQLRIWPASYLPTGATHAPRLLAVLMLPGIWLHRLKMRHELSMLNRDQMRDTGLNPDIVKREYEKPFWEA